MARKSRTLGGKFAKCMSKLHSTCPEAIFRKIVFFWKIWLIEHFFWDLERNFFGYFACFFPQVRQTSILHIEETSSVKFLFRKIGSTILFGFLMVKIWRAHEVFFVFFGVQLADSGHKTFWETCFTGVFVRLEPSVNGRLAGKLGAGLFKLHFNGSLKLSLLKFFRKTSTSAIFSWREEKYMQSFCGDFLRR